VLIGRDSEMALVASLVVQAAAGTGSAVLVEGEPGVGKSTLVRAALAGAPSGVAVFSGAGDELGQALPLLPMLEALRLREPSADPRRTAILALLRGELAPERGTDASVALAEQLLALVTEECARGPVVLVIDDLQWADHASVALWGRLARLVPQLPLLLVGTMRPVPQRDELITMRRAGRIQRIRLTGLPEDAVAVLVGALVGGLPDDRLLRLAGGAAGNPLYITELLAALARSAGVVITESGTAELASGSAPESLSAAIADRLGFVSGEVREVLRAAALLGVEFSVSDLGIVLHRSVPELIPAVDQACAAGVLAESGNGLGFRHQLIRAALYDAIQLPVRAAWHREAARSLAEAGAPPDRVARQLLGAGGGQDGTSEPMQEWMLTWLIGTADLLVGQAPRVAAELLGQAVASVPSGSAHYEALVGRLADTLYRIGDMSGAEQVASRALAHVREPDLLTDLHWTLAQCRMWTGRSRESLETLYDALESSGLSVRHRARLLVMAARTHLYLGEVEKAGKVAQEAMSVASESADNWTAGWALHVLIIVTAVQGQNTDALPLFDQALAVTEGDPALTDLRLLLQINKAVTLGNLDRYQEAILAARQATQLAERAGSVVRLAQAHTALSELLFDTGQWDEAMTEVHALPEAQKEPGAACCELGVAAVICAHRGEVAQARDYLAAAGPHAERIGNRLIGPLALARSLDREQAGDLGGALAELTSGFAGDTEELEEIEDLLASAVRLALATGDQATAASMAGHATDLAAGSQIPHRQANALYCQGLLHQDAAALLDAASSYKRAGRPLLRAQALEAAAVEFVRSDDRGQARAAFTGAVEAYAALGAATDVARLQAAFRAHGIRRGPRAKHRQAVSGWDSLTPAETKVAALVEHGMTNPEIAAKLFLSRRTVATHVSHILKKLAVNSRTDIAREAALRTAGPR